MQSKLTPAVLCKNGVAVVTVPASLAVVAAGFVEAVVADARSVVARVGVLVVDVVVAVALLASSPWTHRIAPESNVAPARFSKGS